MIFYVANFSFVLGSVVSSFYKTKGQDKDAKANEFKYINLDPSFQDVNRLFVMAYSRADNNQPTKNDQRNF